jgi:transposase
MKYTIKDFRKQFPNDAACLAFLFNEQHPDGIECPSCQHKDCFYPILERRCYSCSWCGHQISPTAGTIFHKSPTPLTLWFHAIFLMSVSKNGVAAKELERQLGVTYKCAWRIAKQIRLLMKEDIGTIGGHVEIDETYIGGVRPGKRGRGAAGKTAVFGAVERQGRIKLDVIEQVRAATLMPLVQKTVAPGTEISTDESNSYNALESLGYTHRTVKHGRNEFVRGKTHTNTIDGFWSQFKRSLSGTHHSVSPQHLQKYADEFSFRYNHRRDLEPLTSTLLSRASQPVLGE